MNRKALKRICSLLLCLVMALSLLPAALAAEMDADLPQETDAEADSVPENRETPDEAEDLPETEEALPADELPAEPEEDPAEPTEEPAEPEDAPESEETPINETLPADEAPAEPEDAPEAEEVPEDELVPAEDGPVDPGIAPETEDPATPEAVPTEPDTLLESTETPEDAETPAQKASGNAYVINGVTIHYDDFTSIPHECWTYANNMYCKIWGQFFTNRFDDSNNSLRNLSDSELTLTAEHLKAYVSSAALGSVLRICNSEYLHGDDGWGHSQIIVAKDDTGFTVVEGGLTDYPYCQEAHYTWSQYVNTGWLGGKYAYIKYIKWPGAPAYTVTILSPTITGIQNKTEGITLSWSAVSGAAKYAVYRKVSGASSYSRYSVTTATSFTDRNVVNGTFYYYRVVALNSAGSILGAYSTAKGITCVRNVTPTISSISNTPDGVKLTWGAMSGVAKYAIYRKAAGESKYTRRSITTAASYVDRSAVSGTYYYYRIWSMDSSGRTLGDWSSARGITCVRNLTPTISSISNTSNGVKLTWGAVTGVAKYAIYRKASTERLYTRRSISTSTSYTDIHTENGTFYYYRVYSMDASGKLLGDWSNARGITCNRPAVQVVKSSEGTAKTVDALPCAGPVGKNW